MSGICGAWSFDGDTPDIGPILAKLERRGPDGTDSWADGEVALGHTLLATTPEALVEVLPLTEPDSGCTITADARLDNREELIEALDLEGETRTIGDGELILRAYLKWGEECPKHLLGDFAFAIWDPREQRLFCARDHMGMRQLIYHHAPGKLFAFATEAEAVIRHAGVPKRINEGRIADFLDDLEGIDFTSTFFEEVLRLPPAHVLTVDATGLSLRRYWKLTPGPELKLDSDQAYADAFLEIFTEAVRCRLRSAGPVGSMLSGGIDSNAVAAVAAGLLSASNRGALATFSAVGPKTKPCEETDRIGSAVLNPGFSAILIDQTTLGSFRVPLRQLLQDSGEPVDGWMSMIRAIYLTARQLGINVVLDGAGGDVSLTSGNVVAGHLTERNFSKAWREATAEGGFWRQERDRWRIFAAAAWVTYVPTSVRGIRHAILRYASAPHNGIHETTLSRRFARKIDLAGRRKRYHQNFGLRPPIGRDYRLRSIGHPHLAAARERYDRSAGAAQVEARDPFMDIRVLTFCLSLPPSQMQRDGRSKIVLRRAMRGLVPDSVIWASGKQHLGYAFHEELMHEWPEAESIIRQSEALLADIFDRKFLDRHITSNSLVERATLANLSFWLQRVKQPVQNSNRS